MFRYRTTKQTVDELIEIKNSEDKHIYHWEYTFHNDNKVDDEDIMLEQKMLMRMVKKFQLCLSLRPSSWVKQMKYSVELGNTLRLTNFTQPINMDTGLLSWCEDNNDEHSVRDYRRRMELSKEDSQYFEW